MNQQEINEFRELLLSLQAKLAREILHRREGIRVEGSPDPTDRVQQRSACDVAVFDLEKWSGRLHAIEAALRRLDDGFFGKCVHCGNRIRTRRLAAVPWASLCIRCQEAADLADPAVLESLEEAHLYAA